MVWIPGLSVLLGWERLSLFSRHGYVEMTRFLITFFFSYAGHIPVHNYAPFMGATLACGASRPLYGGVFTVGGYDEGYFSQHGWQHDLRLHS
jgi:hypothetical protein